MRRVLFISPANERIESIAARYRNPLVIVNEDNSKRFRAYDLDTLIALHSVGLKAYVGMVEDMVDALKRLHAAGHDAIAIQIMNKTTGTIERCAIYH